MEVNRERKIESNDDHDVTPFIPDVLLPYETTQEPTMYELECKSSVSGWEKIRPNMLTAVTEFTAMPFDQLCLNCQGTASIRCQRCGPFDTRQSIFFMLQRNLR